MATSVAEARLGELEAPMASPEVIANPAQLQQYWLEQQEVQAKTEPLHDRWKEFEQCRPG